MKTCPNCNLTMGDSFTICGSCGMPLPDGEPEVGDETLGMAMEENQEEDDASLQPLDFADQGEKEEKPEPPQHLSPFGSGVRAKPSPFRRDGAEPGERPRSSSERPNLPNLTSQPVQSIRKNNNPSVYASSMRKDNNEGDYLAGRPLDDDFVPIPAFASHEVQMDSPFKSSRSNSSASRPAPEPKPQPKPQSANSIFDSNKTGYEHTKPCPRCGAMVFPYDEKCITCGYRLVKIRRINVGAVIAAIAYAICVLLPLISTTIIGQKETLNLLGLTEGYLVLALAALVFVIALTGRNGFIVALGGIALMLSFYITSIRIYQISDDKWGEVIFKNDISYYLLYAAALGILITGLVGLVNSIGRNRDKMFQE